MTETQLQAWLVSWVTAQLGETLAGGEVDIDVPLDELGLSSRDAVALAGELEDRLDRVVPATVAWESPSIRLLAQRLACDPVATAATTAAATSTPTGGAPSDTDAGSGAGAPGVDGVDGPVGVEPIAIIGMACRLPGGVDSAETFWQLLDSGADAVATVPEGRWESTDAAGHGDPGTDNGVNRSGAFLADVEKFDAAYFGITPREARLMDPQQRLLLEVAIEAIQHARLTPASLRGTEAGVFVGISASEYGHLTTADLADVEPWTATGSALSIAANRLSYALDVHGPSLAVDTACSSSLVALHAACTSLRAGESSSALVGGVNLLLTPVITASFDRAGALAPDGRCKAFASGADGIGRGEGCGVIVLKRLSDAQAAGDRVLAVVRGSAVNSDGRSNGLTAPNPHAQEAVLRRACANAGIAPADVDYVEAHGTGTLLGDPIEAGALGAVYGLGRDPGAPLLVGSVKSNIGHLEAAAGIAGIIKVVLALGAGRLPATLHVDAPNPHIAFDELKLAVVTSARSWPRRERSARAGVSGFGFGGTNAHVIIEQAPVVAAPRVGYDARAHLFTITAETDERLRAAAEQLADWLEHGPGRVADLAGVARSLQRQRGGSTRRAQVAASDRAGLLAGLRDLDGGRRVAAQPDRPVWVFSGYGQQWGGMGLRLLQTEPVFAAAVDELQPLLIEHAGVDIRSLLNRGAAPSGIIETMVSIFAVQIALAALWRSLDVEPAAVVGQSMGEIAAAVVSGGLGLADGAQIISVRARLLAGIEQRNVGGMAMLGIDVDEFAALQAQFPDVSVAVYSSPEQCLVGGDAGQIDRLIDLVDAMGRPAWSLRVGGAGHTATVDPVLSELLDELAEIRGSAPDVPFYNTVLDDPRAVPAFDAAYWAANVRRPVRFTQAIAAIAQDGFDTFVEISAHPVATYALRATLAAAGVTRPVVVGSLRRDTDDAVAFAGNIGDLHAGGHPGVLAARYPVGPQVDLPAGPWLHKPYWFEPARAQRSTPSSEPAVRLGRHLATVGGSHVWTDSSAETALGTTAGTGRPTVAAVLALAAATAREALPGAEVVSVVLDDPAARLAGGAVLTSCSVTATGRATTEVFHSVAGSWVRFAHAELAVATPVGEIGPPAAPATPTAAELIDRIVPTTLGSAEADAVSPAPSGAAAVPEPASASASAGPMTPAAVETLLRVSLAEIMGHEPDDIDADVPLIDLGFDSLMATRAQHAISRDFGVPLPVRLLLQGMSLSGLAGHLSGQLSGAAPESAAAEVPQPTPADLPAQESVSPPGSVAAAGLAPAPGYVPPRDPTERLLARLWAEVLERTDTGVTERFTDVGGDPAAAERLRSAITRRLGRSPGVAELLAAATIERMSDLIRADVDGDVHSPVRVLREGDGRRPLFLFHPAGGPTSVYQPLVDRLDPDQPVYGMERIEEFSTVEAKAGRYIELITQRQPEGPYRLMGWSLGGVLASEVAYQLTAAGEQVEFLGSIDTILPRDDVGPVDPGALLTARYQRFAEYISQTYGADVQIPPDIGERDQATQLMMVHQALTAAGVDLPAGVLRHQYTSYVDARIAESYSLKPYHGRMVLYRAQETEGLTTGLDPRYLRTDETLGWDVSVAHLEVVPVPGHHITMIDPPNVDVLAAHLRARLAELDSKPVLVAASPEAT